MGDIILHFLKLQIMCIIFLLLLFPSSEGKYLSWEAN